MRFCCVSLCILGFSVLIGQVAYAACEKQTTVAELSKVSLDGEKAFAESDIARLLTLSSRAREVVLPCLSEKITPIHAAAFHRLMAFEAFVHKNISRVTAEFHASRKLDARYEFSLEVLPEEHRLRVLYEKSLFADDGELKVVFPPDGGYVTVGGVRNAPRPEKTPVIIQAFDVFNKLLETRYLQPGETMPVWGKNPFGITAKDLGIDDRSTFAKPKTWIVTSGVTAVVTALLYGVAMYNKSQFQNTNSPDTPESDQALQGYSDRANAFGYATIATGSLAITFAGLGIGLHVFGAEEKSIRKNEQGGTSK